MSDFGSPQANALLGGTSGGGTPAASSGAGTSDYGSAAANALLGGGSTVTPSVSTSTTTPKIQAASPVDTTSMFSKITGGIQSFWDNLNGQKTVDGVTAPIAKGGMTFPVIGSNIKGSDLIDKSKTLDDTAASLKLQGDTLDTSSQSAVDSYNAKIDQFKKDTTDYNQNVSDYNTGLKINSSFEDTQKIVDDIIAKDPTQQGFLGTLKNSFIPTQFINSGDSAEINDARSKVINQYTQEHPVMSAVAQATGMIANLLLIGKAGGGFGLAKTITEAIPGLANLFPTAVRIAGLGAESGSIFGIQNFLQTAINQVAQKEFSPTELGIKTAEGVGTGFALGGAGALPTLLGRIIAGGTTLGGLTALEAYIKNGKLTSEDLTSILVNTIIGAGFEAVGGRSKTELFRAQEMASFERERLLARLTDTNSKTGEPYHTREEAEKISKLLSDLNFIVKSGYYQTLPASYAENFKDIPSTFFSAPEEVRLEYFNEIADEVISGKTIGEAVKTVNQKPFIPSKNQSEIKNSLQQNGPELTHVGLQDSHGITPERASTILQTSQTRINREKTQTDIQEASKNALEKVGAKIDGTKVALQAEKMGSDQGGISNWLSKEISKEDYSVQTIKINDLLKSDPDLKEYIDNSKGKIRPFEGEANTMAPIVSSSGQVHDGYNRIAQAIKNGETEIKILKGIASPSLAKTIKEQGGITVNLKTGESPKSGYTYSPDKTTEFSAPVEEFKDEHVDSFIEKHYDDLTSGKLLFGGWLDNGRAYLDLSTNTENEHEAVVGAQKSNQIGIYDVTKGETKYTAKYKLSKEGVYQYEGTEQGRNEKISEGKTEGSKSPKINTQAGFIAPGKAAQDVVKAVSDLKMAVEHGIHVDDIVGQISNSIYKNEGAAKALKVRLTHLVEQAREGSTAKEREHVYHYMEDSNYPLTEKERTQILPVIQGMDKTLETLRQEARDAGIYITGDILDEHTPRNAVDKGGVIDKALEQYQKLKKAIINNGSTLSKSVGSGARYRVFHALTDEKGKRTVVSIKDKKVTSFKNNILTDLGTLKMKSREALLKEDVKPIQQKIRRTQTLIDTLESIKVRDAVSPKKLSNLETRIEALKTIRAEMQKENEAKTVVKESMAADIAKETTAIDKLEARLKVLKPFGDVPKIQKALSKLEKDIDSAYEREINLSLSDIYENLSDFVNQKEAIDTKITNELEKTKTQFKILSKVPKAEQTVLRTARLENAKSKMLELINELSNIEATYNPNKLSERVFVDNQGKTYTLGQATTLEIEKNTKTKYYKDPFANYALAIDRTANAVRAARLLEKIKTSPEYKDTLIKEEPGANIPVEFKYTNLQQFRGYKMEPHLAEAFNDLAKRQEGNFYFPIYDEVNNLLISALVINPLMHFPNVAMGWGSAMAANGVPFSLDFGKTLKEVMTKSPDYLRWLEKGAPFQYLRETNAQFADAILKDLTDQIKTEPTRYEEIAKMLGYANPIEWAKGFEKVSADATWIGNDTMLYHALKEYQRVYGGTEEKAIQEVSKRMADYRIPPRILGSRALSVAMQNNAILMFMRYHYSGVLKPWFTNPADIAMPQRGNDQSKSQEEQQKESSQKRWSALRTLAYFAAMYFIWNYGLNKVLQKVTGNPNTYMSMPGAMKLPQNIEKSIQSQSPIPIFSGLFSLNPGVKLVGDILTGGYDLSNFMKPIFGLGGEGAITALKNIASPYNAIAGAFDGSGSWTDYARSLGGIYTPKNTPAEALFNAMLNVEKPQIISQMKVLIASGDTAGAQKLGHDFNERLKIAIKNTLVATGASATDAQVNYEFQVQPNGLGQKGYAVRMPSAKSMLNYEAKQGLTFAQKDFPGTSTQINSKGQPSDINNHSNPGTIAHVYGNVTIYNRMSNEPAVKAQMSGGTIKPYTQLDHIVPLEGGGTNEADNLSVITTIEDGINQPVEDFIGQEVKAGRMDLAQATEISIRFKAGLGQPLTSQLMNQYVSKYGSKPLKLDEIYDYANTITK